MASLSHASVMLFALDPDFRKAGEATLESRRNKLAPDPNSEGQERASGLQTGGSSLLDDDPSRLRVRTDVAPASWLTTARDEYAALNEHSGPLSELVNPLIIDEAGRLVPYAYGFAHEFNLGTIEDIDTAVASFARSGRERLAVVIASTTGSRLTSTDRGGNLDQRANEPERAASRSSGASSQASKLARAWASRATFDNGKTFCGSEIDRGTLTSSPKRNQQPSSAYITID